MNKRFKNTKMLGFLFAFIVVVLILNIIYLGATGIHFISGESIEDFAEARGVKTVLTRAIRGQVYSSDNEIIIGNIKTYRLQTIVKKVDNSDYVLDASETASKIAPLIGMDVIEMTVKIQDGIDSGKYLIEFGNYGSSLSPLIKEQIEKLDLPGIRFVEQSARNYPMNNFASYFIGYAKNNEEGDLLGQMGIEVVYDKELAGTNGYKKYQLDAAGYVLPGGVLEEEDAVDGSDIYLTFNSNLQRELEIQIELYAKKMNATSATCAIMEAKTGKILAVSNYPGFDPNKRDIEQYSNLFTSTPYECGSVFKPFVYANAINDGNYNGSATYKSGTYEFVYNGKKLASIRDWNNGEGFGVISFDTGLARSSNVAICELIDKYIDSASLASDYEKLGFFSEDDLDGFNVVSGYAGYKKSEGKISPLEFTTTGFGQGSTVTAYHLLKAYSVFANNGKTVEPYFVDKIVNSSNEVTYTGTSKYSEQIYSESTIKQMNDLLYNNIYSESSVAKPYAMDNVNIIGKTGTGQVARTDGTVGYRTDVYSKSFAGLAPYEDPQIVFYCMFECPDEGTSTMIGDFSKTMINAALAVQGTHYSNNAENVDSFVLDSYINQRASNVKAKLDALSLKVELIGDGNVVVDQFPNAQTSVSKGNRVFIKTDSSNIALPDMTNWSRKDVLTYASISGIKISITGESGQVAVQSVPAGTIIDSNIEIIVELK